MEHCWSCAQAGNLLMQVFHNLPFSCDELWLFLVPCSASCSVSQHGSSPRDEEFLAVVSAVQKAHGCWCCLFSEHCLIERKLSLEEFQKIFQAWHIETGKTHGGSAHVFSSRGVQVQLEVLGSCLGCCRGRAAWHSLLAASPLLLMALSLTCGGGGCVYFSVLKSCWYGLSFVTRGLQQPKLADGDCSMWYGGGYLQ